MSGRVLTVRHFGPRVGAGQGGGIASVMALHAAMPYSAISPRYVTTYRFGARLHSVQYVPGTARALASARMSRAPEVVHVHLGGGGSLVREGLVARLASAARLPTVATIHASNLADTVEDNPRRVRAVLRAVDVVHALGPSSASILRSVGGDDIHIVEIPNPVDAPTMVSDAGDNPPVVLYAGELSLRKGLDILVAAWPHVVDAVPEARLVVVGEERDCPVPEGVGIEVMGPVPRATVQALLRSARVAVLPSRRETQPMFLLEAMAAARPVVATAIAEIPGMVSDPAALVPPGDVEALVHALVEKLCSADAATAAGRAGRAHVLAHHSLDVVAARFQQLYLGLVGERSSPVSAPGRAGSTKAVHS